MAAGAATITLTVTLPAPLAMEVVAAVDHFAAPAGVEPDGERPSLAMRRADALVALAGVALAAKDDPTGRPRCLVHVHTGDDHQEAPPDGERDEAVVGVSDATTERLCCDADEEVVTHDSNGRVVGVTARSSVIRGRLRRLVRQRDRTCRVPGCNHRARHEIHHLAHRGRGGTNHLDNLLLVCAYHHHRLHEGGWHAVRLPDGTVQFTLPNSRVLPSKPTTVVGDADLVQDFARDAIDGRCQWQGDHLDLDWTLMSLFSQTPWHDPWLWPWLQRHHLGSAEPLPASG